jgi:hypothetical protein
MQKRRETGRRHGFSSKRLQVWSWGTNFTANLENPVGGEMGLMLGGLVGILGKT